MPRKPPSMFEKEANATDPFYSLFMQSSGLDAELGFFKNGLSNRAMLERRRTMSFSGAFVLFECRADKVQSKPQASVYDILPPKTAIPGYAMQYCKLTDSLRLCPNNSKLVTNRQLKLCQALFSLLPLTMLTPAQTK